MSTTPTWKRTQRFPAEGAIGYAWFRPAKQYRIVSVSRLRPGQCFIRIPPCASRRGMQAIVIGHDTLLGSISPVEFVRDGSAYHWKRMERRKT